MTNFLILSLAVTILSFVDCKNCIFKASRLMSRPISAPLEDFQRWFALPDIPTRLIILNPGVEMVEQVSDKSYKSYIRPIKFPWAKIISTIEYDVELIKGERLNIICGEDAIKQRFEGPKLITDAIKSLKMSISGSGTFYIDTSEKSFYSSLSLQISFPMPNMYPDFLLKVMEKTGSRVVQDRVDYDLAAILDNALRAHATWKFEECGADKDVDKTYSEDINTI